MVTNRGCLSNAVYAWKAGWQMLSDFARRKRFLHDCVWYYTSLTGDLFAIENAAAANDREEIGIILMDMEQDVFAVNARHRPIQ